MDANDVLALGRFPVTLLPLELGWLLAYDFNGDGVVDAGEMTQAWLLRTVAIRTVAIRTVAIRTVAIRTGRNHRPEAPMTVPRTASL